MENLKEFTRQEFNEFVEKNNLEAFSQKQVDAFCKDVLEKSEKKEIDEFELNCAAADKISLTPVIVRDNNLSKSLFYYREAQREPIENLPDGIFKSMNDEQCLRYKETPLNILKGIAGINCADKDALEKAKALSLGTEKMYGGKMYVKTEKGWRPKKKDKSSQDVTNEDKKIPGSFKIENKTFHVKDGIATISMYDKQSRISKLQKLAKEHGFKINYEK